MPRHPTPWYRKARRLWYVEIGGKQYNLGSDCERAFDRYHRLMSMAREEPQVATGSVVAVFDLFLEWTKRHRAPQTYKWYTDRLQRFSETLAESIRVSHLKPLHVQNLARCQSRLVRRPREGMHNRPGLSHHNSSGRLPL